MSDSGVAVVIEDDTDMRNLLEGVLLQAGFEVHTAAGGREGVQVVRDTNPDIVTVDVGLPDIDGFEVLRRIRQFSNAYIVMLTGRSEEADLLNALQAGADDYITKPFRPREMRARITAVMRRPRMRGDGGQTPPPSEAPAPEKVPGKAPEKAPENAKPVLTHNGLSLDGRSRTATMDGKEMALTRSEFDLLLELLREAGAVRSKAELIRAVRGSYYDEDTLISAADERAAEVHITNLRRKLHDDTESQRWLQTVRGVGYRLASQEAAMPPVRPGR